MTEFKRIADGVDRELRSSEPTTIPDARRAVTEGRRALRRRRAVMSVVGSTLAVGAIAAVAVGLSLSQDRQVDAADEPKPAYDSQIMPEVLESSFRDAVAVSAPDLGPSTFFAGDAEFEQLDSTEYDRARFMYVDFGKPGQHEWRFYVGRLASDLEVAPADSCTPTPEAGLMSCSESRTETGEYIRTQVTVGLLVPKFGGYERVDYRELERDQWKDVRLERTVSVIRDGGFEASASERVFGPSVLSEEAFQVAADELEAAAADPEVYFGEPAA